MPVYYVNGILNRFFLTVQLSFPRISSLIILYADTLTSAKRGLWAYMNSSNLFTSSFEP